ncbi:MAG: hypothetical protein R3A44_19080 [Caldilineaceae bacterium]
MQKYSCIPFSFFMTLSLFTLMFTYGAWTQPAQAAAAPFAQSIPLTVPGNSATGVRFDAIEAGIYTVSYMDNASGDSTGWSTLVNIYQNRDVVWATNANGNLMPADHDGYIGFQGARPTRAELIAFTQAEAQPVEFQLQAGDYLTFIGIDEQQAYFDNQGGVDLLITHAPLTCTVTTTADAGTGSLRACMSGATPGTTIDFDASVFPPTAPMTIAVASPLPIIITDSVTIDGSMAGVVLDGSALPDAETSFGLRVEGADSVVLRGLQIMNFPYWGIMLKKGTTNAVIGGSRAIGVAPLGQGNVVSNNGLFDTGGIAIGDPGTSGNRVVGNNIGTDGSGQHAMGNMKTGVLIANDATNNVVGSTDPDERNLISGNTGPGISIQDKGTSGNQVLGNYVGTNKDGNAALENQRWGILLLNSANNTIGGEQHGMRNLISGNAAGVQFQGGDATANQLIGNYIGVDASGTYSVSNGVGVWLIQGATGNTVGGNSDEKRNIISGNLNAGIVFDDPTTHANRVIGNYIGVDITGMHPLANGLFGIQLQGGPYDNQIGGADEKEGNVISGNGNSGVQIQGASTHGNKVQGNIVGADFTGTSILSDSQQSLGISIDSSFGNLIGGSNPGEGNLISGNRWVGINCSNSAATDNTVIGNLIGTDVTGQKRLSNFIGINIAESPRNRIGGPLAGDRNVISGNDVGLYIYGADSVENHVEGNYIGANISGTQAISNSIGVYIFRGASRNTVGGESSGVGNLISGNDTGVVIHSFKEEGDQLTSENIIQGNFIGTDVRGLQALPNLYGLSLGFGAHKTLIGGGAPGVANLISGNTILGIFMGGNSNSTVGVTQNQIIGNRIGADISGTEPLGNGSGVAIGINSTDNTIGGLASGESNLISGNHLEGVIFYGDTASRNTLQNNRIGTDDSGKAALPNGTDGVRIQSGANRNTIGISNTIAYNLGAGVFITGTDTVQNTITQNAIWGNGAGNIVVNPPSTARVELGSYNEETHLLTGQACANCTVEIFANSSPGAQGMLYLGSTQADSSGAFGLTVNPPLSMPYLTATLTQQGATYGFFIEWALTPTLFLPFVAR